MNKILVVDDEEAILELTALTLKAAGYAVETADHGDKAADMIEGKDYDLILLDIMLPGADGFELLDYIAPMGTPVIFLTAKNSPRDKIRGLSMGADDYMVKPFDQGELTARVEAVLRRAGRSSGLLKAFNVSLDPLSHRVVQSGSEVFLSPREYTLLEVLMRNKGIALYREVLFEKAWGKELEDSARVLDLNIMRLRKKLNWHSQIRTVHRIGYMLEGEDEICP